MTGKCQQSHSFLSQRYPHTRLYKKFVPRKILGRILLLLKEDSIEIAL